MASFSSAAALPVVPLRLMPGDTCQIGGPSANLIRILRREQGGYAVRYNGAKDPDRLTDQAIFSAYHQKTLRHWPCNLANLEERRSEAMRRSFNAWPEAYQREAMRRLAYVSAVDRAMEHHSSVIGACAVVVDEVFGANREPWIAEEREAARALRASKRRRSGRPLEGDELRFKAIILPSKRVVRKWYKLWIQCGRDPSSLIPLWHDRGHRGPRFAVAKDGGPDTYKLIEQAGRAIYMSPLAPCKERAFEHYGDLCDIHEIAAINRVSSRTFRRYLSRLWDDAEQCAARHGKKRAYLDFGIFSLRDLPDDPLDEVEIDHCLVDLMLVDDVGRPAGRPWITVLLDRATKCVVGIHISFLAPSYQSVRLAIVHALYEKDLRAFPSVKNRWECFGLLNFIISDRAKEFTGRNFRASCEALLINPIVLPGRMPWLKGAIERFFKTMGVGVIDIQEGATKNWATEGYNSVKKACLTKEQFTEKVIKWIVDKYHQRPHRKLEEKYGKGATPAIVWRYLAAMKQVRFASDAEHVYRITGEIFERKILRTGIEIHPHIYSDPEVLERLLKTTGGAQRDWKFHRDRSDLGFIRVLDDTSAVPTWLTLPNIDSDITNGVSQQQFKMIMAEAKDMTPVGSEVTVDVIREAKRRLDELRAALLKGQKPSDARMKTALNWMRYGEVGALATPVPGFAPHQPANDTAAAGTIVCEPPPAMNVPLETPTEAVPKAAPSADQLASFSERIAARAAAMSGSRAQ